MPSANEKYRIRSFGGICTGIKTHGWELAEFVIQLFAKAGELSQIEWSKIEEKVPVDEFIVDAKEVNLFLVPFGVLVELLVAFGDASENVMTGW